MAYGWWGVPARPSGVTWLGRCTHQAPDSCRLCDGSATDEWNLTKEAQKREAERGRLMRTRPYRREWLAGLPVMYRAGMVQAADEQYGAMPGLLDEVVAAEQRAVLGGEAA